MKIIFMGTSAFAVASLATLHESHHEILLVVSQPDKPAGRGKVLTSPPVIERAKALGLPIEQPAKIKTPEFLDKLASLKPDCIAIVAYGKLLPKTILDLPPKGCVNLHSSLLPKYRGAAPINWAIMNGEKESGVTTMFINEEMDAGDILLTRSTPIKETDNAITLHDILAPMGAGLLLDTLNKIEEGSIKRTPQDHSKATFAPIMKKEDGLIKWKRSAKEIFDHIRGAQPWPAAYTHLDGKLLHVYDSSVIEGGTDAKPGEIIAVSDGIVVATGSGKLCLKEVQLEGKKRLSARDFLNGHKIKIGSQLG